MPRTPGTAPPPNARRCLSDTGFGAAAHPPRPTGRRAILAGLALGAFAPGCTAQAEPATPFAIEAPAGVLRPLGGLMLDPQAFAGGGLSGLHLDPELRLTAVSDRSRWAQGRLVMEGDRPVGVTDLRSGTLRDGAGGNLPRGGHAGDSEALARAPDGTWLIAFERWHRIRAYRRLDAPGTFVEAPPGIERAPRNGGLESLTVLSDGRWLAIAEDLAPDGQDALRMAWIGGPGIWRPLSYRPAADFVPTDAAGLPDGGALVLERRFSLLRGFAGRLVRVPPTQLRPGAVMEGTEILRLSAPLPTDNWEGVAVTRWRDRTLVALVSDDNTSPLQRSMLLLFELRAD